MDLSTVRIHRARNRDLLAVLNTAQLQALPRDEQRRLDMVAVHVSGQMVAVIDPGREAQDPTVIWMHPQLSLPVRELTLLFKQAVVLMDATRVDGALVTA
jgi:hypothetical protein